MADRKRAHQDQAYGREANHKTGADDPPSQSERFIAKAREMGLDEREETFDAALTKVARHKPSATPPARSDDHEDR